MTRDEQVKQVIRTHIEVPTHPSGGSRTCAWFLSGPFLPAQEMRRDGHFLPDEIMYNSILDGCTKQRNVSEALRLLEEMKASGIKPSNYTLSILVKLQLGSTRDICEWPYVAVSFSFRASKALCFC